ncbi:MAG: helix-turn-helix transcriptional regulator [Rhodothermaceae bacterium]|nr:helix-turn-helix transcriptional regulator [Rhodothermaceae bacterium]
MQSTQSVYRLRLADRKLFSAVLDALRSTCPIASSLDLLGDRWTLVVMRDVLLTGCHTFSEIGTEEGIATNVLADRLARLTAVGLLERRKSSQDGRRRIYLPTERGIDLLPVLMELVVWGDTHTQGRNQAEFAEAIRRDRGAVLKQLEVRARGWIRGSTP